MAYKALGVLFLLTLIILGCTGVPKGLEPVSGFEGDRYMGKWYEIARLDHSFERNLSNVIELDRENYSYAMVSGPSRSYLWILSRTPELDETIYSGLVSRAAELGFDTTKLIRVKHDRTAKNILPGEKTKMTSKAAGKLSPCPKSPNCVSSLAVDKEHFIAPIPYGGNNALTKHKLLEILNSFKRTRVVRIERNYIQAEFVSSVFRFVDDVEFYLDDAVKVIQVKSASRTGYSDFGVNRRRVEMIRKKFEEGLMG